MPDIDLSAVVAQRVPEAERATVRCWSRGRSRLARFRATLGGMDLGLLNLWQAITIKREGHVLDEWYPVLIERANARRATQPA